MGLFMMFYNVEIDIKTKSTSTSLCVCGRYWLNHSLVLQAWHSELISKEKLKLAINRLAFPNVWYRNLSSIKFQILCK
jgi:hypothetical protein